MKRIHERLDRVLERHRIVFWYDGGQEWAEAFAAYAGEGVTRLTVSGNEFGTKVRIVRASNPAARFLVYVPTARPADAGNWLLDVLLQGYEFRADRASLVLEDVGLAQEFRYVAEEHAPFYRSEKRVSALRESVGKEDQARDIRLKMMAILARTPADTDALLLEFLSMGAGHADADPVVAELGPTGLVPHFWAEVGRRFGYDAEQPSLLDFACVLFRAANPFDTQPPLDAHAAVFMQRWKDSQAGSGAFRAWSARMEKLLRVEDALDDLDPRAVFGEADAFEIFDKCILQRLCLAFVRGERSADLRAVIAERRRSFWMEKHGAGYAAVEHAIELRDLLAAAELNFDSVDVGVSRYVATWWRIDRAYRRCIAQARRYAQVALTEKLEQWAERTYVNGFLLPLADRFGDQVLRLDAWRCTQFRPQRSFFNSYVQPYRDRGQKVFVIVSDALRYEAAADFAERLRTANRWTAEVDAVFGSLPTYTQLGMASLLPGTQWSIDPATASASVDGHSATGTENRAKILNRRCAGEAVAITADDFLALNTKTEGRELMRAHEVIYIFHNHIDKVGDALATEDHALEAVEKTFDTLNEIIKKVANINGSNMVLTADHGFIFQQDEVAVQDMTAFPQGALTYRNRRFALGTGITPSPSVKVFTAAALGLPGDWSAAFPLSLGRFPLQGSGKRFVHGGITLQEVVVPVVKIHKARTDDIEELQVELLRVPPKITTGQLAIALYQTRAAVGKVPPRTLRIGVYAKDGTSLSEVKAITFDSKDSENRLRETTVVLVMSPAADAFNGHEVELRLEEVVAGINKPTHYKKQPLKIQKRFTSDFDD